MLSSPRDGATALVASVKASAMSKLARGRCPVAPITLRDRPFEFLDAVAATTRQRTAFKAARPARSA